MANATPKNLLRRRGFAARQTVLGGLLLGVFAVGPANAQSAGQARAAADLPDLSRARDDGTVSAAPSGNGVSLGYRDGASRFTIVPGYSKLGKAELGVNGALWLDGNHRIALGGGASQARYKQGAYANLGLNLGEAAQLLLTADYLRQNFEFNFASGATRTDASQTGLGASLRMRVPAGPLRSVSLDAWQASAATIDLANRNFARDGATLFELWNDPRRIAGSTTTGGRGTLHFEPWRDAELGLGLGQERLAWHYSTGDQTRLRNTASLDLSLPITDSARLVV